MRLFVAIPLPSEIAAAAARVLPDIPALRKVAPPLMHVTLAFIGNVPDATLEPAAAAVRETAAGQRPFEVALESLGRFPASGAPRIVWLGAGLGAAELIRIAERARRALTVHGVTFDDKPFRPHVTLARVREDADRASQRAIAAAIQGTKLPAMRFRAEAVLLLQSELSPKGPRYTPRSAAPLDAGGGGMGVPAGA